MKYLRTSLCVVLCAFAWVASTRAASEPSSTEEKPIYEKLPLKVTRVISAKDGDAELRAYLVRWRGQEVVVLDFFARTKYREGDTITVFVSNRPNKYAGAKRILEFRIVEPGQKE